MRHHKWLDTRRSQHGCGRGVGTQPSSPAAHRSRCESLNANRIETPTPEHETQMRKRKIATRASSATLFAGELRAHQVYDCETRRLISLLGTSATIR